MARKARGASKTPLASQDVQTSPRRGGGEETSCRPIKPTLRASGFIHQAGQQRALLAAKEAAAKLQAPSVESSTDQSVVASPPLTVTLPTAVAESSAKLSADVIDLPLITSSTAALLASDELFANPLRPVTSLAPSTAPRSAEQPVAAPCSSSATVNPALAANDHPNFGSSNLVEVQIDPILLALSTAATIDLESTTEIDNNSEYSPFPSQFPSLGNPIPGISTPDTPSLTQDALRADSSIHSTPMSGWRTARISSILAACHSELDRIVTKAVNETSYSTQQILDSWNKSHGRVITTTNHWNLWPSYLAKYEKEERLRAGVSMDAPLTPSLRGRLYTMFKEAHSENWQEILEVHDMLEVSGSATTTISQRTQTFNKIRKQTTHLLNAAATKYGFEAALVMCGNTVNEDASLAFVHTTNAANNFFKTRCRADDNAIIGHLKSHIYLKPSNNVSLEIVSDVFDGEHKEASRASENSKDEDGIVAHTHSDDIANEKSDAAVSSDDVLNFIKDSILQLMEAAGGDVSKIKRSNFPWTSLVQILGDQGLVMYGWPASALMPGQLRTQNSRAKGITALKVHERRSIYNALENNEISIIKVEGKQQQKALQKSHSPIIIGAAPHADSHEENAQRVYYDGSVDFEGPAHLPPDNARTRTRIKPRKKHISKGSAGAGIVLSTDEDTGAVIKPVKTVRAKLATAKVTTLNKGKSKYIPVDDSSSDEACSTSTIIAYAAGIVPSVNGDGPLLTTKNEDDYQAPGLGGKRKANTTVSSQVAKKSAFLPQKRDTCIDDPFKDSQHVHMAIEPSSPSPKQAIPLAPLLETQDEEEQTASSTAPNNPQYPPPFLPPASKNDTEQQNAFEEDDVGPRQRLPIVPPPAPLPPNPVHYQYPLPYFPYPPDMYHSRDPRAIYGPHNPGDASQFGPAVFPGHGIPYVDSRTHLNPGRPATRSSSVELRQLHQLPTERK